MQILRIPSESSTQGNSNLEEAHDVEYVTDRSGGQRQRWRFAGAGIVLMLVAGWYVPLNARPSSGVMSFAGLSPYALAADSDAAWFANGLASSKNDFLLGRVANSLVVDRYVPKPGAMSHGIAVRDKRTWFSLNESDAGPGVSRDAIGMFDMRSGKTHVYEIPTPKSWPEAIAIARDGSVLVAESNANAIGKLAGQRFVEYRVPIGTPGDYGGPQTIAVTGDGNVYFSLARSGRIGMLNRNHIWRFLQTPRPPTGPVPLTAAGDLVWFAEPGTSSIGSLQWASGRIVVRHYRLPWSGVQVRDITASAGDVCFSTSENFVGCYILRMRNFTRFQLPRGADSADSIALAGNRLWFAIGRLPNNPSWLGEVGFIDLQ